MNGWREVFTLEICIWWNHSTNSNFLMEATRHETDEEKRIRRREERRARKDKLRREKAEKKEQRLAKREGIKARIREKRKEERNRRKHGMSSYQPGSDVSCWLCKEKGHSKRDCPKKAEFDANKVRMILYYILPDTLVNRLAFDVAKQAME